MLRNAGAAAVAFDLTFYVDSVAFLRRPIVLVAGASQPLLEQLTAPPPGAHILRVEAATGGLSMAVLEAALLVQEPAITASVAAPPKVGQEAFDVVAKLTNPTQLALDLEIALDTPGATPSPRERVHLAGSENAAIVFHRQVAADQTFVLSIGGDAASEPTCRVAYDAKLDFKLLGAHAQPSGYAVLPLELSNSGGHPWHGDLRWSLRGPTGLSGTVPTNVESGSSARIDIPVSLGPGSWTLHLEAAGVARDESIVAYANGKGILTLTVPGQAVEGQVSIAARVENALATPGEFQLDLDVRDVVDGALVGTVRRVWALDGGQAVVDDFPLDLRAGTFAIGTRLNGEPVPGSQARVHVIPRRAADLAAAVGPPTADGKLPLAVTLRNTGGSDLAGTLMVDGLGRAVEVPEIAIARAGSATRQVLIDPDSLPAGPRPLVLRYASGNGEVLASRDVPFDVRGGTQTLVAAPPGVAATAGGVTPLEFVIANTGMQTSGYELGLQLGGGSVFAGADKGFLRPGQQQLVRFDVPVPADLPQGEIPMEFALMEAGGAGQLSKTVQTGRNLLKVRGVPISVTAAVDRDHVLPGEHVQVILSVTAGPGVSSLPLVAKVSYPPFDERRAFTLSAGETQLRFAVPIASPGQELGYGVYFDSGRALHLDAVAIQPAGGGVVVASSKPEYAPGEELQLVVTLSRPGTLEMYGFGQAVSLDGSGTASVHIPEGLPRGQFPVVWTFYPGGPNGKVENGEFRVKVRGPLVRITRLQASKVGDQRDHAFVVTATILSDAPIAGVAKTWLVTPTGGSTAGASLQLDMGESGTQDLALRFPADIQEGGNQSCVLGFYGLDGSLLASAATQIDVGGARLLAVHMDKTAYPTVREPIDAEVDLQGAGSATLVLRVDGRVTSSQPVTVAGVQRLRVPIAGIGPGTHTLSATLDSAGLSSSGEASFKVGTGLPDLAVEFIGVVPSAEKVDEEKTSEGNLGTLDDAAAGKVRILLRVRNVGQTATPETELVTGESGSKGTDHPEETEIAPLQPGSAATVSIDLKHMKAGRHQLTASVDPEGKINEFTRTNNVITFEVTVAQPARSAAGETR